MCLRFSSRIFIFSALSSTGSLTKRTQKYLGPTFLSGLVPPDNFGFWTKKKYSRREYPFCRLHYMAEFMFEEFLYLRFSGSFGLYLLGVNGVNEEGIVRPQAWLARGFS